MFIIYIVLVSWKAELGHFSSIGHDMKQKLTKYHFVMNVALLLQIFDVQKTKI